MVTAPASMVTGLALNVPAWETLIPLVGSYRSMISFRPPNAPTANPPPMIFPKDVMSGVIP